MKKIVVAALFAVLAGLAMAQSVYENKYLKAVFPDKKREHFVHAPDDFGDKVIYTNDSLMLKIMVCDFSICPTYNVVLDRLVDFGPNSCDPVETSIGGRRMLKFKAASDSDSAFGNGSIYILSNGEVTIVLAESGIDNPIEWWKDNIDIKIAEKSSLPLSDRTNDFVKKMSKFAKPSGVKIKVDPENKHLTFTMIEKNWSYGDLSEDKAKKMLYTMISVFSIFEEYADLGYTFTIGASNGKKSLSDDFTFTHDEYSQWTEEMFESESYTEDDDEYDYEEEW